MIKQTTYSFLVLLLSITFYSCDVDDENDDTDNTTVISDSPLTGLLGSETFTPVIVFYLKTELFGDDGYKFKLFSEERVCDDFQSIGNVEFFIPSEGDLTVGAHDAGGPYFFVKTDELTNSISYFGAEAVITSVSGTQISGKVKGGDESAGNYIEGVFTAQFCAN